jgi:hypothetical protein
VDKPSAQVQTIALFVVRVVGLKIHLSQQENVLNVQLVGCKTKVRKAIVKNVVPVSTKT